jgi:hypothetical protein
MTATVSVAIVVTAAVAAGTAEHPRRARTSSES